MSNAGLDAAASGDADRNGAAGNGAARSGSARNGSAASGSAASGSDRDGHRASDPDASEPAPQVGYSLKQAQSLLHLRMEDALKPLRLTVSHYSCLHHLRIAPGISAAALARRTFVTRQSMNVMLQQLIDRGLVARPDRADSGRALPTLLTPAGTIALDAAQMRVDEVQQRMLSGLTPIQRAALADGLAACVASLAE